MLTYKIYIVLDIQEDSEGYLCPTFFSEEDAINNYPDKEYIEVEIEQKNIFLN